MKKIWLNLVKIFFPWILIQFIIFFLLIWILGFYFNAFFFLVFFLISFLSYLVAVLLFGRFYSYEISVEDSIQNQTGINSSYIPINEEDLLCSWWVSQKKRLKGLLRSMPDPRHLKKDFIEKAMLIEIQGEAEYYDVFRVEKELPISKASSLHYYIEPYPVIFPTDYVNEIQDFPIDGTLVETTCSTCSGSGKVTCSWCHGSGDVTCSHCNGWGKVSTTKWEDGEHKTVDETCTWCHGWGKVSCSHCSGSGKVTCSRCSGEGYLGEFIAKRYEFIHWKKVHVFKEASNGVVTDAELEDLPDKHARYVNLSENVISTDLDPLKIPSITDITHTALFQKKQEFHSKIDKLDNLLFKSFSFREFPELTIIVITKKKSFQLIGRGFKPLLLEYADMEKYPISWVRIIALFVPFLIYMLFFYFLMGF